jgi:NADH pyrophosphatase NudC (nudix superfamily)
LRREVREEVGLEIDRIEYVTSLAMVHEGSVPSLIISCVAHYVSGDVVLQREELDAYAWVTLEEAKEYHLIEGIYDELVMTEHKLVHGVSMEWGSRGSAQSGEKGTQ